MRRRLAIVLAAFGLMCGAASGAPLVAIDAGHGGGDSGAVGVLPPGTPTELPPRTDADGQTLLYEKDVTLDIAHRLNVWLQGRGYPTVMTRTQDLAGGDVPFTTVSADLEARVNIANGAKARLFVSIHENSLSSPAGSGTETFHFYYSSEAAKLLAGLVHQQVVAVLGLTDRGVKQAGFYVLRHTDMPAVLVEGAFLSNPTDVMLLADPAVRQRLAEAIGTGIVAYNDAGYDGLYVPKTISVPRYQVNVGAFRKLGDARSRYRLVRRKGFGATIRSEYNAAQRRYLFYVVAGKYVRFEIATARRDQLRAKGLRANVGLVPAKSRILPGAKPV